MVITPSLPDSDTDGWVSEFDTPTQCDTAWTSANVQEVLPGQVSPMSWSLIGDVLNEARIRFMRRAGIKISSPDPFIGLFYGRPFLNASMLREAAEQITGSSAALDEQYLGVARDPNAPVRRRSLRQSIRLGSILPRMVWVYLTLPREVRRFQRFVDELEAQEAAHPFGRCSTEELLAVIAFGRNESRAKAGVHVAVSAAAGSAFERLGVFTKRWLSDESGALRDALLSGWAGVESARPAYHLWELSRLVLASPGLSEVFVPSDGKEIERRLGALSGADAEEFGRRLGEFLERHGHRSVMEGDISAPTWAEDVPSVLVMVRNYLRAGADSEPRKIEERQRREREAATSAALSRLGRWKRLLFRLLLRQAQQYVSLRERSKSLLIRANNRGRRLIRELARRLAEEGLLAAPEDVYYLTWREAVAVAQGECGPEEAAEAIRRRRAEETRNRAVKLPDSFVGRPRPLAAGEPADAESHILRGLPVAPGRVTGLARVILDPRDSAAINPGEILVAPVTDAAWTPLFVAAAGIVVDIGGTLSHGSIVAREYGRPAVVNVRVGTRVISTGQRITVDGSQGLVILET